MAGIRATTPSNALDTGPIRHALVRVLVVALALRLVLAIVLAWWAGLVAFRNPAPGHYYYHDVGQVDSLLGNLCCKWDSYWYLNIIYFVAVDTIAEYGASARADGSGAPFGHQQ